jgi:adenylate kinase family enzyme
LQRKHFLGVFPKSRAVRATVVQMADARVESPRRLIVGGISGSGKSTLARKVSRRLGVPYVELDSLHHGPGWVKRPEFEADVAAIVAEDRWVIEDQYHAFLGDLLWRRADTLLWLDFSRPVVMQRVLRRSVSRAITRRELWNGNRENPRDWLSADHPIRYAWSHHGDRRSLYEQVLADPAYSHLAVVRLATPAAAREWLRRLTA